MMVSFSNSKLCLQNCKVAWIDYTWQPTVLRFWSGMSMWLSSKVIGWFLSQYDRRPCSQAVAKVCVRHGSGGRWAVVLGLTRTMHLMVFVFIVYAPFHFFGISISWIETLIKRKSSAFLQKRLFFQKNRRFFWVLKTLVLWVLELLISLVITGTRWVCKFALVSTLLKYPKSADQCWRCWFAQLSFCLQSFWNLDCICRSKF